MHFPRIPVRYGGIKNLFTELMDVLQKHAALPPVQAELATFWIISTWFADCLFAPPILWISGSDMYRAMALLSLLQCLCRRGLVYAGLSPSKLPSLPALLRPTLLVNAAEQSSKRLHLFMESNFRGTVVPGNAGRIADVTGAKAIFAATQDLPSLWSSHALALVLSPLDDNAVRATEQTRAEIAHYFQARLFRYRLNRLQAVRDSQFEVADPQSPSREIARALGCCIQRNNGLALRAEALLRAQADSTLQTCSVETAIVEILWPYLHPRDGETPVSRMKMEAEFTKEVNTYLRSRGEILTFTSTEVGKKVAALNLPSRCNGGGNSLILNRETSRRIHRLAHISGAGRNMPECRDCEELGRRDASKNLAEEDPSSALVM